MKQFFSSQACLIFFLSFFSVESTGQTITRGPYLQMVNETAATIRWRTNIATTSRVNYGTTAGVLNLSVSSAVVETEHELRITGLINDTKYFYNIGTTAIVLDANTNNWFITAPDPTAQKKIRIAAFGDCGIANANQANVRDQYLNYIGSTPTDLMILLGDNAYSFGFDSEYQSGFFNGYKNNILRNHPLFPAPGNHDYRNDQAFAADRTIDYFKNFTMPKNAECGGVASNTEAYYSYDWGNIHFLALDSYGKEDANTTRLYDTLGAQVTWIKQDLAATNKKWVIVYFHHPPFTLSSHNSDLETELVLIRQNFIRILERYGVDLILCGHSHGYERSYLLKGYYTNQASFSKVAHTADSSSAKYDGSTNSCPYHYNDGKYSHGTVYVVSGSAGQTGSITTGMSALPFVYGTTTSGGSSFIEVDDNRLDLKMIGSDGLIKDKFTIMKDVNKVSTFNISSGGSAFLPASWPGNYVWNTGATTNSILVSPAVSTSYTVRDNLNCLKDSFRVQVNTILPVGLTSFSGQMMNDRPALFWTTAEELNILSYELQRSYSGVFSTIATIASKGAAGFQYQYDDISAIGTSVQYRLKINGRDGSFQYSNIIILNQRETNPIFVFPSMAKKGTTVTVKNQTAVGGTYQLTDNQGKILLAGKYAGSIRLHTSNLNAGVYYIVMRSGSGKWTNRFCIY